MQTYTPELARLLTGTAVVVGGGAELLDDNDQTLEVISSDLRAGGKVDRSNYANIHGSCTISLTRKLDWANARVRLFQTLRAPQTPPSLAQRVNLGVFLLPLPDQPVGKTPATFDVQGLDKLKLLQKALRDTYVVPAGTGVLAAVNAAIVASGYTGIAPRIDATAQAKVTATAMVWHGTEEDTTWLNVINDLLDSIAYRGLYADELGRFRSEPYIQPYLRPPEWVFDLTDPKTDVILHDRKYIENQVAQWNWWRFIRDGMTTQPTEGDGLYTVDRTNGREERPKRPVRLTAADQESLVAQGDRVVATDTQRTATFAVSTTGPFPILGHFDVSSFIDPVLGEFKVQTSSHSIPVGRGAVTLNLEAV